MHVAQIRETPGGYEELKNTQYTDEGCGHNTSGVVAVTENKYNP